MIDTRDKIHLIDTCLLDPKRTPFGRKWLIEGLMDFQYGLMVQLMQNQEMITSCENTNKHKIITNLASTIFRLTRPIEAKRIEIT